MEVIKIYDLSQIAMRAFNAPLKSNELKIYIGVTKNGKMGTHSISFSSDAEFVLQNKRWMSIAENTLTGDLFLLFSDKKDASSVYVKDTGNRSPRPSILVNKIVRFIATKLNLPIDKAVNEVFMFTENLSKREDVLTYKIINK